MSIELNNPKTPLELADAIGNLIEQIRLANMIGDKSYMGTCINKAAGFCFQLIDELQKD